MSSSPRAFKIKHARLFGALEVLPWELMFRSKLK